jgi:transposase
MAHYSKEFKAAIIQKMMPPNNVSVSQLMQETGISDATLYSWRKQAQTKGVPAPGKGRKPAQWRTEEKFSVVLETMTLNEIQLSEYCRKNGLFPELITEWKEACMQANDIVEHKNKTLAEEKKQSDKRVKELERELRRKDKALAETAALLVLSKKAYAIWGEEEGE